MELLIYISGKVTGEDKEACKQKFEAVEKKLYKLGAKRVINPMKLGIPDTWTHEKEMVVCMKVLREQANTLFQLKDWTSSEGAMEEYQYARNRGYRIFDEDATEDLVKILNHNGKWIDTSHLEHP